MTKKIRIAFSILILNFFLINCSGLTSIGDSIRNTKTTNTDEFLIQKKKPLTEPPDYKTLPEPKSVSINERKENELKKILKTSEKNKKFPTSKSSSAEDSILGQISR